MPDSARNTGSASMAGAASLHCTNCRRPYPEEGLPHRCPTCGGVYDFQEFPAFDPAQVDASRPGIWRYGGALGLPPGAPETSLGEGNTPLVWAEAAGRQVAFKLEFLNPTGSFKDRGSAALVSALRLRGAAAAVEDSSGNAGASFAAYAARAGMGARVYVPESASGPKRAQIEAYGAEVVSVPGPRSNASEAVAAAVREGAIYASHAYLPFNLPGYATAAYELYEQLGGAPGGVVTPVGQGGLLLGLYHGFGALHKAGLIEKIPPLVGVQARACAPLWALSSYGLDGLLMTAENPTLAEGVRVSQPVRGDAVLQAVESTEGVFLAVDEAAIRPGRDQLAHRGLYVEMTSALVWSALQELEERFDLDDLSGPLVVMLTGSGLKTP